MNITVSKKDLLRAASKMVSVAESRGTMPILAHVCLTANDSGLHLASTDLYLALRTSIAADVGKPGAVSVVAKDFAERLKNMADGPIDLSTKDGGLILKSKGTARRYTLRSQSGDDFPPMPSPDASAPTMTLDAGTLSKLIALTSFSISGDETRAHLSSLLVEWDGGTLRAVSTDGHRLSKAEVAVGGSASATLLIPAKAVGELRRLSDEVFSLGTAESPPTLTLIQSGPSLFVRFAETVFSVKLVDAAFPPWRQVVPQRSDQIVRAPRVALLDACRAVSVAASDRTGGVKFAVSKGLIRIFTESPDTGDGLDEVPVDYAGPNISIGFNAKYITDILSALSCDEVTLGFCGDLDPMLVKPVGETPMGFEGVVMPMRLN